MIMSGKKVIDVLPELYGHFLSSYFKSNIHEESIAACDNCAMKSNAGALSDQETILSFDYKCCTYYPNLSNYMIGAILSDTDAALKTGRDLIRKKIKKRIGVTPHGIHMPKKLKLLYDYGGSDFFGRSRTLICPYYSRKNENCTIWPYRNAVCCTWFCKHESGRDGQKFWLALRNYIQNTEETLSYYALHFMGWDPGKIMLTKSSDKSLDVPDIDERPPDKKTYDTMWGDRVGREEDFYKEAYRIIAAVTPKVYQQLGGISQKVLLKEFKKKYALLQSPKLPEKLTRNPKIITTKKKDGSYMLVGYSPADPLEVPKKIYDMLDFFDGRLSNREVCGLIILKLKNEPSEDLLMVLYQMRILIAGSHNE
jgi:hypothetical protein